MKKPFRVAVTLELRLRDTQLTVGDIGHISFWRRLGTHELEAIHDDIDVVQVAALAIQPEKPVAKARKR